MYKTIIISILIIIVINYIIHFLKNSFTIPMVKFIPDPQPKNLIKEVKEESMKEELNEFLMSINI